MPKLSKKQRLIGVLIAIVVIAGIATLCWPKRMVVKQTARHTFSLDQPYSLVRKTLVRTDATKEIITLGENGEVVEYKWLKRGLALDPRKLLSAEWEANAEAVFQVRTDEDYIGQHVVAMHQDVHVTAEHVISSISLERGTNRLIGYQNDTRFLAAEDQTRVETSLTLTIAVTAPRFVRAFATEKVLQAATEKLQAQEKATRQVMINHANNPLLKF